jgi:hypothetical protein
VSKGPHVRKQPRKRTKNGRWRKKRSDTGKKREKKVKCEHLAACSSLTADELLDILDDLFWGHENSYLHEEPYLEIPMGKLPRMEDSSEQEPLSL